ncbi:MAG: PPC domain-containing protein [Gemmataceae bacterium]
MPRRDSAGLHRFDYLVHPAAPAAKLRGWQVVPPGLEAALNPATLVHADAPVTVEREPNDTAAQAHPLTLPAVVCGRFDRPGDADWYRIELKAGETIQVDLLGERLDRPGDPFVFITDDKGNERAQLDDHGITFNALALYNRDPNGTFTAPAAGTYRLLVQERYRQGGPRHGYVLRLRAAEPDFYPVVFHETNPDPTCPVVRQGGSAHLEVCLNRRSFSGPVVVEAKGLPAGVTCPPIHVSPQTDTAVLVFSAAVDAREWAGPIRVMATGTAGERTLVREACAVQRRWAIANINTSRLCREVCLAVRPGAAYQLRLPETATVSAGGSVPVIATVRRHGDFKGKVQLTGLGLPPGFSLPTTDVPEGKDTATVTLMVANNVPPGRYSVTLRGDGQVPFSKDAKATSRPNVRVADPSTPLVLTVQPAAKKAAARAANRAGGVAQGPS